MFNCSRALTPKKNKGYRALVAAFEAVTGSCAPYSITGSLPCIRDLQDAGFDVQTMGFGKLSAYHANNEFALLPDLKKGFKVMATLAAKYEKKT